MSASALSSLFVYVCSHENDPVQTTPVQLFKMMEAKNPGIIPNILSQLYKLFMNSQESSPVDEALCALAILRKQLFETYLKTAVQKLRQDQQEAANEIISKTIYAPEYGLNSGDITKLDKLKIKLVQFKNRWKERFPTD